MSGSANFTFTGTQVEFRKTQTKMREWMLRCVEFLDARARIFETILKFWSGASRWSDDGQEYEADERHRQSFLKARFVRGLDSRIATKFRNLVATLNTMMEMCTKSARPRREVGRGSRKRGEIWRRGEQRRRRLGLGTGPRMEIDEWRDDQRNCGKAVGEDAGDRRVEHGRVTSLLSREQLAWKWIRMP